MSAPRRPRAGTPVCDASGAVVGHARAATVTLTAEAAEAYQAGSEAGRAVDAALETWTRAHRALAAAGFSSAALERPIRVLSPDGRLVTVRYP